MTSAVTLLIGRVRVIIIIIIQHLYSAIVSYAGCRGACGAS